MWLLTILIVHFIVDEHTSNLGRQSMALESCGIHGLLSTGTKDQLGKIPFIIESIISIFRNFLLLIVHSFYSIVILEHNETRMEVIKEEFWGTMCNENSVYVYVFYS